MPRQVNPMSLSAELKRLSNLAFQMEEEIERLRAENVRLSQPQESADLKAFLDAMEPTIANEEQLIGRLDNKKTCALFRVLRPK